MKHLRALLKANSEPIYFIDWCLFTALGMEKHIGNIHFITATDTFNGLHPNIFVPPSFEYNHALSSEETLNALLANPDVEAYIKQHGKGKMLTWLIDAETERLAQKLGLEICLPPHALRLHWDNKANTNRLAEKAGVRLVPYILSSVTDYAHLRKISAHLGPELVVQMPHGMSGQTTFYITDEADFNKHEASITNGEELKIMRRINCRGASLEACITRSGVAVSPLIVELIGIPQLTIFRGGWCGDEFLPHAFPENIRQEAHDFSIRLGEQLQALGYYGYFQADFLIDTDSEILYLGELNLRFSGFTPLINNANIAEAQIPLLLLHLAHWLNLDSNLDIQPLNQTWLDQEQLQALSFIHLKHVHLHRATPVPTGVYKLNDQGQRSFVRQALSPEHLQPGEVFWFSSAGQNSIIEQGDELGGLFLPMRVTDDGKTLQPEALAWVEALNPAKPFGG
jgi:D-alanine-D-alanine ligase-like ATP-grasp enzyme